MTPNSCRALIVAVVSIIVLLCIGIAGSYVLTTASVNSERHARMNERVPACTFAMKLIEREAPNIRQGDMALYNATGCPKIIADREN